MSLRACVDRLGGSLGVLWICVASKASYSINKFRPLIAICGCERVEKMGNFNRKRRVRRERCPPNLGTAGNRTILGSFFALFVFVNSRQLVFLCFLCALLLISLPYGSFKIQVWLPGTCELPGSSSPTPPLSGAEALNPLAIHASKGDPIRNHFGRYRRLCPCATAMVRRTLSFTHLR
jgi:hypothetical protein